MHIRGIRGNANVCTLFVGLTLMIQYVFYYIAVCVMLIVYIIHLHLHYTYMLAYISSYSCFTHDTVRYVIVFSVLKFYNL